MKVLVCTDYDATTETCVAQTWMEMPSLLPPLSTADAMAIGSAVLLFWASVMAVKVAMKKSQ